MTATQLAWAPAERRARSCGWRIGRGCERGWPAERLRRGYRARPARQWRLVRSSEPPHSRMSPPGSSPLRVACEPAPTPCGRASWPPTQVDQNRLRGPLRGVAAASILLSGRGAAASPCAWRAYLGAAPPGSGVRTRLWTRTLRHLRVRPLSCRERMNLGCPGSPRPLPPAPPQCEPIRLHRLRPSSIRPPLPAAPGEMRARLGRRLWLGASPRPRAVRQMPAPGRRSGSTAQRQASRRREHRAM